MSITLEMPQKVESEVRFGASRQGVTFAQFIFNLVEKEASRLRAERERHADECVNAFDELVRTTSGRLDQPYKFNREDAYYREESRT